MIVVRNVFQIKYGKIKEAIEIWKELIESMKETEDWAMAKLMTDISGPAYNLVLEVEMRDLLDFNYTLFKRVNNEKSAELYKRFLPLCYSSVRTLYKVEF